MGNTRESYRTDGTYKNIGGNLISEPTYIAWAEERVMRE